MIRGTWQPEDEDDDPAGTPPTALASIDFLVGALRRRWRLWLGLGLTGLLLGAVAAMGMAPPSRSTLTLILVHSPGSDPAQAMATDISFMRTRSVASDVIDALDLPLTPDQLQASVTLTQLSSTVLGVTVAAADPEAAQEVATALAASFLEFRQSQMEAQSAALASGYGDRIKELRSEIADITQQYKGIDESDAGGQAEAADLLARRSQLSSEVDSLQETLEQVEIETAAMAAASHVLDPPSEVPPAGRRRVALAGITGAIAGAAIGVGIVLFGALTSSRLRRREDVALALGTPVRFSVPARRRRIGALLHRTAPQQPEALLGQMVATAFEGRKKAPLRLAIGAVDNIDDCEGVVAGLVASLVRSGKAVFVADLSSRGRLDRAVARAFSDGSPNPTSVPSVARPEGASLARGPKLSTPDKSSAVSEIESSWRAADVVVVLIDIDPGAGIDQVASWARELVPVVTAGRSSAERLRTTAELIRSSGVDAPFAAMVGADTTDESLGRLTDVDSSSPAVTRSAR